MCIFCIFAHFEQAWDFFYVKQSLRYDSFFTTFLPIFYPKKIINFYDFFLNEQKNSYFFNWFM